MARHRSGRSVVEGRAAPGSLPSAFCLGRLATTLIPGGDTSSQAAADTPKIIARLPFVPRIECARSSGLEAAVICPIEQEPTGRDRSLACPCRNRRIEIGARRIEDALSSRRRLCGLSSKTGTTRTAPPAGCIWLRPLALSIRPASSFPRFH